VPDDPGPPSVEPIGAPLVLMKVTVGQDVYLGTADEVVLWMSKAEGAPPGDLPGYMRGIAARVARASPHAPAIDVADAESFLESLADAGFVQLDERTEASRERVDPKTLLDEGPVAFGGKVSLEDLEQDVFGEIDED
jgi:hypothetical protein